MPSFRNVTTMIGTTLFMLVIPFADDDAYSGVCAMMGQLDDSTGDEQWSAVNRSEVNDMLLEMVRHSFSDVDTVIVW